MRFLRNPQSKYVGAVKAVGDASWDKIGELIKLNHFPKSEALRRIGEHTSARAFPHGSDLKVDLDIHFGELENRLNAARERAAKRGRGDE